MMVDLKVIKKIMMRVQIADYGKQLRIGCVCVLSIPLYEMRETTSAIGKGILLLTSRKIGLTFLATTSYVPRTQGRS
jgi:hypothetical protein